MRAPLAAALLALLLAAPLGATAADADADADPDGPRQAARRLLATQPWWGGLHGPSPSVPGGPGLAILSPPSLMSPCLPSMNALGLCSDVPVDVLAPRPEEPVPAVKSSDLPADPAPPRDRTGAREPPAVESQDQALPGAAPRDDAAEGHPGARGGQRPPAAPAGLVLAAPEAPWALWVALALALAAIVAVVRAVRRGRLPLAALKARGGPRATARDAVLAAIRSEPGIHKQQLLRNVGRSNGTVEHHVERLVAAGLVVRVRRNGYTCLFPAGALDRSLMGAAAVLKSHTARSLLQAVAAAPGLGLTAAAGALGASVSTIHYHLTRLAAAGLVQVHAAGMARHAHATPLGHQALQAWSSAPPPAAPADAAGLAET